MTADADRVAELEATVTRHTALLATIVGFLESDLEASRLEGRRLDANTAEVELLSRRVKVLELARDRTASSRELVELAHRIDELELVAGGHAERA